MLDVDYACRVSRISVSNIGIDNRILSGTLKKKIDLRFTPILSWAFVIFFDLVFTAVLPTRPSRKGFPLSREYVLLMFSRVFCQKTDTSISLTMLGKSTRALSVIGL